ncbi:zinc-ribbon domain-containing protein [Pseudobutyrivibrio sp. YE44]|uniref:zinc-ribbon domain-containing protein n=1 Tax=Pseudobutyrivibrio sp. YE44 TaxID=1520802 RepID=UPI0015A27E34|nr:zinc-ribbon domain-containing protein [Pseudobutyrivibrio sp. YE44]
MEKKSLLSEYPEVAKEWAYDLNEDVRPEDVAPQSNKKYWWKCNKGHAYQCAVTKRTSRNNGCPFCSNHQVLAGFNDFASLNPDLMDEWLWEENDKADINPEAITSGSATVAWWKCKTCGSTWQASIVNRARKGSGCPYCANLRVKKGFNDLLSQRPEIAGEWDYEKNGELLPDEIVYASAKKVWWKCKDCGNSWHISPNNRTKTGCPYCQNLRIKVGYNDLATVCPELMDEWDYEKNQKCDPLKVGKGSEKKVWWKCNKGHSWKAQINTRVRGNSCPICSNKQVLVGYNNLFFTNPELKKEWDYEKNTIDPDTITAGSNARAFWKCTECGNSWNAIVYSRTHGGNGTGCPECSLERGKILRLRTMAENNPLFEQYPHLRDEWDYEKNAKIDISIIPASSNKKVWWKCKKGHSFKQQVNQRTSKKANCPYCAGQRVISGENDLQTLNPKLAEEWDYEKNAPLTPDKVLSHAAKHVWWRCPICGNSWKAKINNRAHGRGCPSCNNNGTSFVEQAIFYYMKKVFPDAENRFIVDGYELDIFVPSKKLAIEYDGSYFHSVSGAIEREIKKDNYCKNNGIQLIRLREKPLEHTLNAMNLSCDCTTWELLKETCTDLFNYLQVERAFEIDIQRDYHEILESKVSLIKENSIAKLYPNLLQDWDYEKNYPLLPEYFTKGSRVKVWWKCASGHLWQAAIANRCGGSGCRKCYELRRASGYYKRKK